MKLPRDLSGHDLAQALRQYGYLITRQTGSHLRLKSTYRGPDHFVTIPAHQTLKVGTLNAIISAVGYIWKLNVPNSCMSYLVVNP